MALLAERSLIRRTRVDWRGLSRSPVERADKLDLIEEVGQTNRTEKPGLDTETERPECAGNFSSERLAARLWDTVAALRLLNQVELAEDYLIARVADWTEQHCYDALRNVFDLAARDCNDLVDHVYDDLADEKISTYVVTLSLTRAVRDKLSTSWAHLYERAYTVVQRSQGEENAIRILGRPD